MPAVPPLIQRNYDSYDWAGPRAWACYRPDADVLLPMYYTFAPDELVAPLAAPRPITALLRFAYRKGDGKNLVEHYGHRLRYELLAAWRHDPLEGSSVGMASKEVSTQSLHTRRSQPCRSHLPVACSACGNPVSCS